jgi:serine/threonine-protein kinase
MPVVTASTNPRVVGRYALFDAIGSGGMATVHLGRLLGAVGFTRTVAVKRLHPQFAEDPELVTRFLDEARLAARLRHPNVVPTLDVIAEGSELLLVMDYVLGESLSRLLRATDERAQRVPVPVATTLLADALEGLHAAHEATAEDGEPLRMVHRDMSPQNVLVGADGIARVLDFGIATAVRRLQVTRGDQLRGKLGYMAPEQLARRPVDRRTDVYSASVVLWETLTARRLFDDEEPAVTLRRILAGDAAAPGTLVADLPAGLDQVVMRGLALDPDGRFATASEMAAALESVVRRATPREVALWVKLTAGSVLERRAALLREVEASSATPPPVPARARSSSSAPRSVAENVGTGAGVFTEPGRGREAAPGRSRVPLVAGAAAVAAIAVVGLLVAWPSGPSGGAQGAVDAGAQAPLVPWPVVATASAPVDVGLDAAPDSSAQAPAAPPAFDSALSGSTPPRPGASVRRLPGPGRDPALGCRPPYTIDKDGVRVPKPACYQ